jgi:hypothetical protein
MNMGRWIAAMLTLLTFTLISCEKDIDIELDQTSPSLVVEATIENSLPPRVILSKSLDYFGKLDPALLLSSFVRNARVTITENGRNFVLREDSVRTNGITLYFYTTDSLLGKLNTGYSLNIEAEGRTYAAETRIPAITRSIDSLWWEKAPVPDDSSFVKMMIKATDRPGFGDYIRYFTKTNSEPFFPGFNSVFDDQVIDGKQYTIQVDRGVNKNVELEENDFFFQRGDTAVLKLCNIDKATYDFWRTFEFNFQGIGNPFSNPTIVISNISNGALGYFGGYAAQYRTLIIPK